MGNSKVPNQATWRTSDGSAWWLRSTKYTQPNGPVERPFGDAGPNGDYRANCYLDLWRLPSNENTVQFNDQKCNYHSRSYYCQPNKPKPKPKPKPRPPPPRRIVPASTLRRGIFEEVYYFKQGGKVPSFKGKVPSHIRPVQQISYTPRDPKKPFPGFKQNDNFAVRWSGFLLAPRYGKYKFLLGSDDGSNLYINNKKLVNNDGLHKFR